MTRRTMVLILGAAVLAAAPLAADVLVLRNGSRVETKGGWAVKGKLVVFTQANGRLASLRADEVDLTASAEATAEVKAPPPPPPPPKQAVVVLTDDDVAHISPAQAAVDAQEKKDDDDDAEAKQAPTLRVRDWEKGELVEGMEVTGTLANETPDTAANLSVRVIVFDDKGKQIGRTAATVGNTVLPPGATTSFRAVFPAVDAFSAVKFESDATFFKTAPADAPGGPPRDDIFDLAPPPDAEAPPASGQA